MIVDKSNLTPFAVSEETVFFPPVNGEVVLRGWTLGERLKFFDDIKDEAPYSYMSKVLAESVRDANGEPLFTAPEWDALGGMYFVDTIDLYNRVNRLIGGDVNDAKKNSLTES